MKKSGIASAAMEKLQETGVKPTSNRLLVMQTLLTSELPVSLLELEAAIGTMERSSILRVLNLLVAHDAIHTIEDGRGVTKYELCGGEGHCSIADMHVHFYCERCGRTYCFEEVAAPAIPLPPGFSTRSVNYMLKGICPGCGGAES